MRAAPLVVCDVAVVGAGGAGLGAALRSAALGLRVVLVTRGGPGGRLRRAERIAVREGLPIGLTGEEAVERAVRQAERLGVRIVRGEAVRVTGRPGLPRRLVLTGGQTIEARAVIAATGAERSTGTVDGVGRLLGAGVHTRPPWPGDGGAVGGNAFVAGEAADAARAVLALCASRERVVLVTESPCVARALPRKVRAELQACGNVAALPATAVVGVDGVDRLEVVVLRDTRTGRLRARTASSLWLTGAERARTEWLPATLERDATGRIRTGGDGRLPSETALRGVFAAGDTRVGAPCGVAVLDDGADAAEQVGARLRLDGGRPA